MTVADRLGLERLYGRLSDKDRFLRFFSGGQPTSRFFDDWTHLEEDGGLGLVVVRNDDEGETIIADAGYSLVPDGDGELGIVIDPAHRGGTGAWLLDALLAHAAARGISNLQAVVRADNRGMIGLARRRGYAILGHPEWHLIQLTMGTSGHTPTWPPLQRRPRVLIESDRSRCVSEEPLREAGFEVMLCTEATDPLGRCPFLRREECLLLEGADVVVVDFGVSDAARAELLHAHDEIGQDSPVVRTDADRNGDMVLGAVAERVSMLRTMDRRRDVLVGSKC